MMWLWFVTCDRAWRSRAGGAAHAAAAWATVLCLLVVWFSCASLAAAYGVTVPVATLSGGVDNSDCVFAVRCAELPAGIGVSNDTLPAPPGSDAAAVATATTVYIGRAAGRCQRKLHDLKCKLTQQIILENQCRALSWPDEEVAPGLLAQEPRMRSTSREIPSATLAACIVRQCHRQRIVIQYFYPRSLDTAPVSSSDLLYLQLDSIANYSTSHHCNTELDIRPSSRAVPVYEPPLKWHTVQQEVLLGPFGTSSRVPVETCTDAACAPPKTLPTGYGLGTCNVSTPLGFHCTLVCLDGYDCSPSLLQVQCAPPFDGDSVTTAGVLSLPPSATPSSCELSIPAGYTAGTCTLTSLVSGSSCSLEFPPATIVPVVCTRGTLSGLPLSFDDVSTLVRQSVTHGQLPPAAGRRLLQEGDPIPIPDTMVLIRTVLDLNNPDNLDDALDAIVLQLRDYLRPNDDTYTHFGLPIRLLDGHMVLSGIPFRDWNEHGLLRERANAFSGSLRNPNAYYYSTQVHEVTEVDNNGLPTRFRQLYPMVNQNPETWIVDYAFEFDGNNSRRHVPERMDQMQFAWNSITRSWLRDRFDPEDENNEVDMMSQDTNPAAPFRVGVRIFALVQEVFRSHRIRVFFIETVRNPGRISNWVHGIHAASAQSLPVIPHFPPTQEDHRWCSFLIIYRQWGIQSRLWAIIFLRKADHEQIRQYQERSMIAHPLNRFQELQQFYPARAADVGVLMPRDLRLIQTSLANRDGDQLREDHRQRTEATLFHEGVQYPSVGNIFDRMLLLFSDPDVRDEGSAVGATRWLNDMADAVVERVRESLPDLPPVATPVSRGTLTHLFVLVAGALQQRAAQLGGACGSSSSSSSSSRRLLTDSSVDCTTVATASQIIALVRRQSLPVDIVRHFRVDVVGDVTSDGYSDLILRDRHQRPCSSLLLINSRNSHAPFVSMDCLATNITDATVTYGDFDGDGFVDQLIRNGSWPSCDSSQFGIAFGASNGSATRYECISSPRADPSTFSLFTLAHSSGSWLVSQSIADRDLCPSHLTLLQPRSSAGPSTSAAGPYLAGATCIPSTPLPREHAELLSGDFDGDGQNDLFFICDDTVADCNGCASRAGVLLLAHANAVAIAVCFPHVLNSDSFPQPGAVQVVDINADGIADVVQLHPLPSSTDSCPPCGHIAVYPTLVSATTDASSPTLLSWPATPVCTGPSLQPDVTYHVGDLNADGLPDLLVAHDLSCVDASSSYWLSVNGSSVFSQQRCMSHSFAPISPASFSTLIDINGDGVDEILTQASDEQFASVFFLPIEL